MPNVVASAKALKPLRSMATFEDASTVVSLKSLVPLGITVEPTHQYALATYEPPEETAASTEALLSLPETVAELTTMLPSLVTVYAWESYAASFDEVSFANTRNVYVFLESTFEVKVVAVLARASVATRVVLSNTLVELYILMIVPSKSASEGLTHTSDTLPPLSDVLASVITAGAGGTWTVNVSLPLAFAMLPAASRTYR